MKSIKPGFRFALEYMMFEVNGKMLSFIFYPHYGKSIYEKVKPGDRVSLKVSVNLKMRQLRNEMDEMNKELSWFMFNDRITEIEIGKSIERVPVPNSKDENRQLALAINGMLVKAYPF